MVAPNTRSIIRLSNVDWTTYSRLLRAFEPHRRVRLAYDRGELEIMSPTYGHDSDGRRMGFFVLILAEEMNLPLHTGGSVTMRRRWKKRGIEADDCFWIENAHRMQGKRRLNLRIDPPPDLAVEVDVTNSSLDRFGIYAALRVPEIWRLASDLLTFHVLDDKGVYQLATRSRSFPGIQPGDLMTFIKLARESDDITAVTRAFRQWVRERQLAAR